MKKWEIEILVDNSSYQTNNLSNFTDLQHLWNFCHLKFLMIFFSSNKISKLASFCSLSEDESTTSCMLSIVDCEWKTKINKTKSCYIESLLIKIHNINKQILLVLSVEFPDKYLLQFFLCSVILLCL